MQVCPAICQPYSAKPRRGAAESLRWVFKDFWYPAFWYTARDDFGTLLTASTIRVTAILSLMDSRPLRQPSLRARRFALPSLRTIFKSAEKTRSIGGTSVYPSTRS